MTERRDDPPTRPRSAWLGAQLGATAWLLISGALMLTVSPPLAAVFLLLFLAVNATGELLWRQRFRRGFGPAVRTLVVVAGVAALVALVTTDAMGHLPALWRFSTLGGSDAIGSGRAAYLALLVFPALLALFRFLPMDEPPRPLMRRDGTR